MHRCEAALARAQISEIETADIRREYAGQQAPRPNRPEVPMARVTDNLEADRLREEDLAKGRKGGKGQSLRLKEGKQKRQEEGGVVV